MGGDSNGIRWKSSILTTAAASLVLLPGILAAPQPLPAAVPAPVAQPQPEATLPILIFNPESVEIRSDNVNINREAVPAPEPEAAAAPEADPNPRPEPEAAPHPEPVAEPVGLADILVDSAGEPISPRDGYCNGAQYCAFSGALYITGGGGNGDGSGTWSTSIAGGGQTPAQQAQCPAGYPQRCDAIGESDYCCPANNYCAFDTNHAVACCPSGQTCQGAAGGYWPTSTYYTPTTYWGGGSPQPTTVYVAGGGGVAYVTTTTQPFNGNGNGNGFAGYCSTLIMSGATLPTTAQGECGTILILPPSRAGRVSEWVKAAVLVWAGMQVVLGMVGFGVLRVW